MSSRASALSLPILLLVFAPLQASDRPQPSMLANDELTGWMPDGAQVETRLDADVTGDGLRDLVFVARSDDTRVLKVLVAYATEVDMGFDPLGEMRMGDAALSVKKGVLIVEDLDGGTTAIQSLYRFRFDAKARRFRLIGDDVSLYSRTNAHDMTSMSTNRLTGVQIVKRSVVDEDGYTDQPEQKKTVPTRPIYMEDAPSPAETLGWGD
jgi:hypothetical protein